MVAAYVTVSVAKGLVDRSAILEPSLEKGIKVLMRTGTHILIAILFVLFIAQAGRAESWGPWSNNRNAPTFSLPEDRQSTSHPSDEQHSIAATPFLWLVAFYQKTIGYVNQGRCDMYPTCSRYCILSIRKHGPAVGIMMTADRIIHEGGEQDYVRRIRVGTRYRFYDPVESNDFWWYDK